MSHPQPTPQIADTSVGVATAFYAALVAKDADAIGALVDRWFADDAVLVLPPSLPYGGRIETARRLRRMFTAMAQGDAAAGPTGMTIAAVAGGEEHVDPAAGARRRGTRRRRQLRATGRADGLDALDPGDIARPGPGRRPGSRSSIDSIGTPD